MSKTLSILIPTYNRAPFLKKGLQILCSYIDRGLDFQIIICNNGSTDDTKETALYWKNAYNDNIKIINQPKNLGYDINVYTAIKNVETDFFLILGDTRMLDYEDLQKFMNLLNKDSDLDGYIINCDSRLKIHTKTYYEINDLIKEQAWHITNLSACVFPKESRIEPFLKRYIGTQFIHFGLFIEYICSKENFRVLYLEDIKVKGLTIDGIRKESWGSHLFSTFGRDWYKTIMSLPNQIDLKTKEEAIISHNDVKNCFSLMNFYNSLLRYGEIFRSDYKKNRKYIISVSRISPFYYSIVSIVPLKILHLIHFFCSKIRKLLNIQ